MEEAAGFSYSQGELLNARGQRLVTHTWRPTRMAAGGGTAAGGGPRGVVVFFHGYNAHGRYPTVLYPAEMLARRGFICCSMDFAGHGLSPGQPAYIADAEDLTVDGVCLFEHARKARCPPAQSHTRTERRLAPAALRGLPRAQLRRRA